MNNHQLRELMNTSMERLKELVDVNTIIGEQIITQDGTTIIPISKVSFGFGSGGTEFSNKNKPDKTDDSNLPFGGGVGGGVNITPIAFITSNSQGVALLELNGESGSLEKVITSLPDVVSKLTDIFSSKKKDKQHKGCKDQEIDKC